MHFIYSLKKLLLLMPKNFPLFENLFSQPQPYSLYGICTWTSKTTSVRGENKEGTNCSSRFSKEIILGTIQMAYSSISQLRIHNVSRLYYILYAVLLLSFKPLSSLFTSTLEKKKRIFSTYILFSLYFIWPKYTRYLRGGVSISERLRVAAVYCITRLRKIGSREYEILTRSLCGQSKILSWSNNLASFTGYERSIKWRFSLRNKNTSKRTV
jgi:hypothetical protein